MFPLFVKTRSCNLNVEILSLSAGTIKSGRGCFDFWRTKTRWSLRRLTGTRSSLSFRNEYAILFSGTVRSLIRKKNRNLAVSVWRLRFGSCLLSEILSNSFLTAAPFDAKYSLRIFFPSFSWFWTLYVKINCSAVLKKLARILRLS